MNNVVRKQLFRMLMLIKKEKASGSLSHSYVTYKV